MQPGQSSSLEDWLLHHCSQDCHGEESDSYLYCSAEPASPLRLITEVKKWEKKDFKVWHSFLRTSLFILTLISLQHVFLIILYLNSVTYQIFSNSSHHKDEPILSALWATAFNCEWARTVQKYLAQICQTWLQGLRFKDQQTQVLH